MHYVLRPDDALCSETAHNATALQFATPAAFRVGRLTAGRDLLIAEQALPADRRWALRLQSP